MNAIPEQPNILWICSDQQRADTIGALGNSFIQTPNIDSLCQNGIAFSRAYCQSPICTPSRSSFLTGKYPSTVRSCGNGNEVFTDASTLIPKLLRDAGYDCGLAGKLHLSGADGRVEPRPKDDGYRVFHWSHSPYDYWDEGHDYADWVKSQGHRLQDFYDDQGWVPAPLHQTTWCTDRAIDFIREPRTGPWMISINYFDPHVPFDPPQEYLERYEDADLPQPDVAPGDADAQRRLANVYSPGVVKPGTGLAPSEFIARYYAMITLIDDNVGRLFACLDETGQRENTIVIFMSDHGEMLGDHGLISKGCRFYEPLVRVPLVFSWPRQWKNTERVSDALVELVDLAPTLLDVAGAPVPDDLAGRSLLPLLQGDKTRHRDAVRSEFYHALSLVRPGRANYPCHFGTMYRTETHKLIVYHGEAHGELFDLPTDPGEHHNLWDDPSAASLKLSLMQASFDSLVLSLDRGSPQTLLY